MRRRLLYYEQTQAVVQSFLARELNFGDIFTGLKYSVNTYTLYTDLYSSYSGRVDRVPATETVD